MKYHANGFVYHVLFKDLSSMKKISCVYCIKSYEVVFKTFEQQCIDFSRNQHGLIPRGQQLAVLKYKAHHYSHGISNYREVQTFVSQHAKMLRMGALFGAGF